jgi:hypothetical protein
MITFILIHRGQVSRPLHGAAEAAAEWVTKPASTIRTVAENGAWNHPTVDQISEVYAAAKQAQR